MVHKETLIDFWKSIKDSFQNFRMSPTDVLNTSNVDL